MDHPIYLEDQYGSVYPWVNILEIIRINNEGDTTQCLRR